MTYFHSLSLSGVRDRYEPLVVILLVYTPPGLLSYFRWLISIVRRSARGTRLRCRATITIFFNGFFPTISATQYLRENRRDFFLFFFFSIHSHDVYICMRLTSLQGLQFRFQLVPFFSRYLIVLTKFFLSFFVAYHVKGFTK